VQKAFVLAICGLLVSACSNIPGLSGDAVKIQIESKPPGAEASLSSVGTCRTPCAMPTPDKTDNYTVTFSLNGYSTQTISVRVTRDKPNWFTAEKITIDPNPVTATLQPARSTPQARQQR
jgi:PEGA domain